MFLFTSIQFPSSSSSCSGGGAGGRIKLSTLTVFGFASFRAPKLTCSASHGTYRPLLQNFTKLTVLQSCFSWS